MEYKEVYRRPPAGTQPAYLHTPYKSTQKRSPMQQLIVVPQTITEVNGPVFNLGSSFESAADLTRQHSGEPIGERIVVGGALLDEYGRPLRRALVEVWQANAAGRYVHSNDNHEAPIDPNFTGSGYTLTDDEGRYRFVTIKPGAYPWQNHHNAWRPSHIHFSLSGSAFVTRLVTQMYFPGDPLLAFDPIFNCVSNERARDRLIAEFDWNTTQPGWALGYRFDIVVRGRNSTPTDPLDHVQ